MCSVAPRRRYMRRSATGQVSWRGAGENQSASVSSLRDFKHMTRYPALKCWANVFRRSATAVHASLCDGASVVAGRGGEPISECVVPPGLQTYDALPSTEVLG